jgi:hypothetical protein
MVTIMLAMPALAMGGSKQINGWMTRSIIESFEKQKAPENSQELKRQLWRVTRCQIAGDSSPTCCQ